MSSRSVRPADRRQRSPLARSSNTCQGHRVDYPPGMSVREEYVLADDQQQLLTAVDAQPWRSDLRRRVQHYGYRYDYRARSVDLNMYLGALPEWVGALAQRLCDDRIFDEPPDQLIINEYEPGQGIAPHIDCVPCFGPVVASLSLGSACMMEFARGDESAAVFLRPGSLLILTGDARFHWQHSIRPRRSDVHAGTRWSRSRRVSLTFRNVRLSTHAPSAGTSGAQSSKRPFLSMK